MNKHAHTYQTPFGWINDLPEHSGALWYGKVLRGVWHDVAVIRVDDDNGMLLVSGRTFFAYVQPESVIRDGEQG